MRSYTLGMWRQSISKGRELGVMLHETSYGMIFFLHRPDCYGVTSAICKSEE